MSMFDSIWADCPKCKERIEFQSKSEECCLMDYEIDNVPFDIGCDIVGKEGICPGCGAIVIITGYINLWVGVKRMEFHKKGDKNHV